MLRKIVLALFMLSFTGTTNSADWIASASSTDWLEDLAYELGPEPEWNNRVAERIMEKCLQEDAETIAQLEEKIKADSNGILGIMHKGAYYVELKAAQSSKVYHERVARILSELPENKTQRIRFLENLALLYKSLMELKVIQKEVNNAGSLTEKLKVRARILAKLAVIQTRKTIIKSSFLIS